MLSGQSVDTNASMAFGGVGATSTIIVTARSSRPWQPFPVTIQKKPAHPFLTLPSLPQQFSYYVFSMTNYELSRNFGTNTHLDRFFCSRQDGERRVIEASTCHSEVVSDCL